MDSFRKRYSTTGLKAFEATARTGSFAAAARELHITRPAVSRHVKNLEERLGAQLIDRATRPLTLTAAGTELFRSLREAFQIINNGLERAHRFTRHASRLRLLVEHDFANGWLSHNIGQFLVGHPGISLEIRAVDNSDLRLEQDYDLRIFYNPANSSPPHPLTKIDLCSWFEVPLCSPTYSALLRKRGHQRVEHWHVLHDRDDVLWRQWRRLAGLKDGSPRRETTFSETSLCLAASAAGAGVTIADTFLARDYIASGRLVSPLPVAIKSSDSYILLFPKATVDSISGRKFISWLTTALKTLDHTEACRVLDIRRVEETQPLV